MFKAIAIDKGGIPSCSAYYSIVDANNRRICNLETWGFSSCGVWNLWGFGYLRNLDADAFFNYLLNTFVEDTTLQWQPKEALFMLSTSQVKELKALVTHKDVKQIDRFYNKAHGPNHLHLFRWSPTGDWGRRKPRKAKENVNVL
jgi:hypothetical protein